MPPEEGFIINVFCLIDDLFQKLFPPPLRTLGYGPKLSGSEVIPIPFSNLRNNHWSAMEAGYSYHNLKMELILLPLKLWANGLGIIK